MTEIIARAEARRTELVARGVKEARKATRQSARKLAARVRDGWSGVGAG